MSHHNGSELEELTRLISESHPDDDLSLVEESYKFAVRAHDGQKRKDNNADYFTHPYRVAHLAAEYRMDAVSVAAALLHDTIEDASHKRGVSLSNVRKLFGPDVAEIVNGVTKLKSEPGEDQQDNRERTLRYILEKTGSTDVRILIIKIFDRYDNIQSLSVFRKEKQLRIARETVQFYIPLADRLGLFEINRRMETMAFRYLYPERYNELKAIVEKKKLDHDAEFRKMKAHVETELTRRSISWASMRLFPRNLYEIHRMLKADNYRVDQIDEVPAYNFEIIVTTTNQCYLALWGIHELYPHLPQMIKDFVSNPKINDYQSLHTIIRAGGNKKFQCLIRTQEMADQGYYGIILKINKGQMKALDWLKVGILDNLEGTPSNKITDLVQNLFFSEINVYTPQQTVFKLPEGSTALDFAYHVHTDIGDQAVDALINGKAKGLSTVLHNGDTVLIQTSVEVHPRESWLGVVKTDRAKLALKRSLRRFDEDSSNLGYKFYANFLELFQIKRPIEARCWTLISQELKLLDSQTLFREIHYGRLFYHHLLSFLIPHLELEELRGILSFLVSRHLISPDDYPDFTWIISDRKKLQPFLSRFISQFLQDRYPEHPLIGLKDIPFPMPITLKNCCKPQSGDEIVALTTKERGAAVHKKTCGNVKYQLELDSRNVVEAFWKRAPKRNYVEFAIAGTYRPGLLGDLIDVLDFFRVQLVDEHFTIGEGKAVSARFRIYISETDDTDSIITKMRCLEGIADVTVVTSLLEPAVTKQTEP